MSLSEKLATVPQARVAIISPVNGETRFVDLNIRASRVTHAPLTILLCTSNIVEAVRCLVCMDGYAENIFIASAWHDKQVIHNLALQLDVDLIITDKPETFVGFLTVHSITDVDMNSFPAATDRETSWLLTTSGTTGTPKVVAHTLQSLTRSLRIDETYKKQIRWGLIYDFSRFAGMQVVLQSILSGSTLVVPDFGVGIGEKIAAFVDHGVTHLSTTPTMWRKILMTPSSNKLKPKQITLGGEIADQAILSALENKYHDARITHIFASTEAGVGFSVTDCKAGFPVYFIETPPAGITLKVENDLLHIKNMEVKSEYLFDRGTISKDGWVNTGDRVKVEGERVFFLGRESGLINVGGEKVYPEEVENALLSLSDVLEAKVYAKSNPIMGALIAADIVLREEVHDPKAEKQRITKLLSTKLEKNKIPALMRFVDSNEVNVAGKLVRN